MKIHIRNIVLGLGIACFAMSSCTNGEPENEFNSGKRLEVLVRIKPAEGAIAATRAVVQSEQDEWSYRSFSDGDVLGFYASATGGTSYVNAPMMFSEPVEGKDPTFKFLPFGDENFDPSKINGRSVFLYFPYSEDMPSPSLPSGSGMPLRVKSEPYSGMGDVDSWRCLDFLVSNTIDAGGIVDGTVLCDLFHYFSELIIMRGDGFINPKAPPGEDAEKIVVVLKNPYTHVKVNYTLSPFATSISLVNDATYNPNEDGSSFNAKEWVAWKGGNYGITEKDEIGTPASYVILPTNGTNTVNASQRTQVDYIQLYDDEGILQTVKDLHLDGNGNTLSSGWRYPMVIKMEELVPTVFPYTITQWGNDTITNQRERGITQDTFQSWLETYNAYITSGRNSDNNLELYGDKINPGTGNSYWHFYLLDNINMSVINLGNNNSVIPTMEDVIDGMSSPMRNPVTISGLKVPFIGEMKGSNDSLLNMTFDHPDVKGAGVIATTLRSGVIDNCTVTQGVVTSTGVVGMFCGAAEGGYITNSNASGVISGSNSDQSSSFLVGSSSGGFQATGNKSTVIFNNNTP